jgi:hypothetical protein
VLHEELRKKWRRQGLRLSRGPDPLQEAPWRGQVRQPADQRASLWQLLQPLRGGRAVRGRGVRRRLP